MAKAQSSWYTKATRKLFWMFNRQLVLLKVRRDFGVVDLAPDAAPLPEDNFIMVSNHSNFSDPWIVGHYSVHPVSIMMNEEGFKSSAFTRWYLRTIGAFPKKKGLTDITAIKASLRTLKEGYPLLVFPEGQTSWDGSTQPIYPGIEKIAQKAKVALVINRVHGNFLCEPWWSTSPRKGEFIIHRKVISAERVQEMSAQELHQEMLDYLQHNDIETYQDQPDVFVGKDLCDGLEQLLWVCPKCGNDHSLTVSPNEIECSSCTTTFSFNGNMTLTEPLENCSNLYDWVALQKSWAKEYLAQSDKETIVQKDIRLVQTDYRGRHITLDTGSIEFDGVAFVFKGEDGTLTFPVTTITAPIFQQKNILQFDSDNSTTQFMVDKKPLFKWLFLLRYATGYSEVEERKFF